MLDTVLGNGDTKKKQSVVKALWNKAFYNRDMYRLLWDNSKGNSSAWGFTEEMKLNTHFLKSLSFLSR